jgi:hypothetical protein
MAYDRCNEDRYGEISPDGRPEDNDHGRDDRPRKARTWTQDWAQYDETRYRPFGVTGSISTLSGGFTAEGRPYVLGGRYEDLPADDRACEAQEKPSRRAEEARSWWKRAQDVLSSWFGDIDAARRRTALDRPTVQASAGIGPRVRPG